LRPYLSQMLFAKLPKYDLVAQTDENGDRVYQTPDGAASSVTTILSNTKDKTGLNNWIKWKGAEQAEKIRRVAGHRGNLLHDAMETYFQTGAQPDFTEPRKKLLLAPYWKAIEPVLGDIVNEVVAESCIWHPEGYAGRFDDLAHVLPGRFFQMVLHPELPSLLDWKTADKPLAPFKVYEYSLQLAAYIKGIEHVYKPYGITVKHAAIIAAVWGEVEPLVYEFDEEALEQLFQHFLARLRKFAFSR
jgi:hypothetical protein